MAIPRLNLSEIVSPREVVLTFDKPLDTGQISVPLENFYLNQGEYEVTSYSYKGDFQLSLLVGTVDPETLEEPVVFNPETKLVFSYEPPADILSSLRGVLQGSLQSDVLEVRRVAVRSLYSEVQNNLVAEDTLTGNLTGDYPFAGDAVDAAVDQFVLAFGRREAIQISNIDEPSANTVNTARIKMALEDAHDLIDSYHKAASEAGKYLVSSNRRRTALIIARYYLDTSRKRTDVKEDYDRAIKELEAARDNVSSLYPEDELARNNGGIMRIHRIPQRYNGVNGKGLDGWWTDPAARYRRDWRGNSTTDGYRQNNDQSNRRSSGSNYRDNLRPTDGGSVSDGSEP